MVLVTVAYFSPLGTYKLGGVEAKPILKKWQLFSITLCTTIATGILFWGVAEPIYHIQNVPLQSPTVEPETFAMSTLFMHWSFTPYAIYTLMGVVFAIGFYKYHQPFSVGTSISTALGKYYTKSFGTVTSIICLFALIAGMAASLSAGIFTISSGLQKILDFTDSTFTILMVTVVIVAAFTASAFSGLLKGIKWLSVFNAWAFVVFALFIALLGPLNDIVHHTYAGLKDYLINFIPRSIGLGGIEADWKHSWTIFYWANWIAWAPVTALFLGKIAKGYTVKQFISFNFFWPAVFGILWMGIFGGSALGINEATGGILGPTLDHEGVQGVIYALLEQYPMAKLVSIVFLLIVFLSFVTAADSNTTAISELSLKSTDGKPLPGKWTKLIWGIIIGMVAFITSGFGVDGIRILSVIGGFPVLIILLLVAFGLIKLIYKSFQPYSE